MEIPCDTERQSSNAHLDPSQPQATEIIHESVGARKSLLPFRNRQWQLTKEKFQRKQRTSLRNPPNKKEGQNTPLAFCPTPAEEEGFEPPEHCCSTVFKTAAFDHSAIPPSAKVQFFTKSNGHAMGSWVFFFQCSPQKDVAER